MATLTTPRMALPYPDGAERVMDGDNAIGALASAIDLPLAWADNPPAAHAAGTTIAAVAAGGRIPLTSILGNAGNLNTNAIRINPGMAGLYLVAFEGQSLAGAAGSDARVVLRQSPAPGYVPGTRAGAQPNIHTTSQARWNITAILTCGDGDDLYAESGTAWSHLAYRFTIVRLGRDLLGALAERREMLEREEELPA